MFTYLLTYVLTYLLTYSLTGISYRAYCNKVYSAVCRGFTKAIISNRSYDVLNCNVCFVCIVTMIRKLSLFFSIRNSECVLSFVAIKEMNE